MAVIVIDWLVSLHQLPPFQTSQKQDVCPLDASATLYSWPSNFLRRILKPANPTNLFFEFVCFEKIPLPLFDKCHNFHHIFSKIFFILSLNNISLAETETRIEKTAAAVVVVVRGGWGRGGEVIAAVVVNTCYRFQNNSIGLRFDKYINKYYYYYCYSWGITRL